jgi:hypothetical protein
MGEEEGEGASGVGTKGARELFKCCSDGDWWNNLFFDFGGLGLIEGDSGNCSSQYR